jgi:hypothetical protein
MGHGENRHYDSVQVRALLLASLELWYCLSQMFVSRYSCGLDRRLGFDFRQGRDFSLLHSVQTGSGVHPASCPVGTGWIFCRAKQAGAWSWPLIFTYRDEVLWRCTSTPQYVIIVGCLIKHRNNFTFFYLFFTTEVPCCKHWRICTSVHYEPWPTSEDTVAAIFRNLCR